MLPKYLNKNYVPVIKNKFISLLITFLCFINKKQTYMAIVQHLFCLSSCTKAFNPEFPNNS